MADRITPTTFHRSEGVRDWRVLNQGASANFRTGSFARGVALVDEIGRLADAADHHPDVNLRYASVTVRLSSHDVGGLSDRDVELARQISAAAAALSVDADPAAVQLVDVGIDVLDGPAVRPFWQALLGYRPDGTDELADPRGSGPGLWFQQMDVARPQRNRVHLDVVVPHDEAEKRVAAAIAAGGHLVSDARAPAFWVLADAEGNEACVTTWTGRD